jgi:hypothetical protein
MSNMQRVRALAVASALTKDCPLPKNAGQKTLSKGRNSAMKCYERPQVIGVHNVPLTVHGTQNKGPSLASETYARPNVITLPAYEADE